MRDDFSCFSRVRHRHRGRSAQEQSRPRKQCSHRGSHVHGHHPALSLSYPPLRAGRLEGVGPFPLTMWSHCTRGVQVNSGGDGSHGVSHGVITLFLYLNMSLHAHRCINHLVDELDLGHLHHLLDSLDEVNLSVRCCQCGHWSRANNGRDWSHALDNKSGMCTRDCGCGRHVSRNKNGLLHSLLDDFGIFHFDCVENVQNMCVHNLLRLFLRPSDRHLNDFSQRVK